MARYFLGLRVAGLRNRLLALRSDPNKRGSFIVSAMIFGWLAWKYGPTVLDTLRRSGSVPGAASLVLPLLSFSVLLSWIMGPLAGYGAGPFAVDNFRLLPLSPTQLANGMLVGSVVSPGLAVSTVFIGVSLSGFPMEGSSLPLIVAAVLVLLALCVLAGRIVGLGVGVLSRHRRSRDLLVLITLPVSLVPLLLVFELSHTLHDPSGGSPLAGAVDWIPLAWPGRAMAAALTGQPSQAWAFLAASLVLLAGGWWLVIVLARRALLGEDRSHAPVHGSAHPFASFARRLPGNRLGAVAAAELRGVVRDTSRIPQLLVGTLILGGMFTAIGVAALLQTDEQYAALGAIGLAFVPMTRRLNEFGLTGPAYWMDVVAPGSARDDLLGRDLAAVLIDAPLCLVVVTAIAIGTRGLEWLPAALVFVFAGVAVSYTVTRVSSTLFASGQALAKDSASSGAAARDPRSVGIQLGAMLAVAAGVAPIVAAVIEIVQGHTAWTVPLVLGALVYGATVYGVGLVLVSKWLEVHEPRLLAQLGG